MEPTKVAWRPIETYEEWTHALFWLPKGERGLGGVETGTMGRDENGKVDWTSVWTHGGPNSGLDFEFREMPTHWAPVPEGPK
jgi:hypothetical protein